jgi:putative methanogen marker protein 4
MIERIMEMGRKSRGTIGIGMAEEDERIKKAVERAEKYMEVRIFNDSEELLDELRSGGIEAGVRGTLSASKTILRLRKIYSSYIGRVALFRVKNFEFFFLPVGVDEGRDLEEKLKMIGETERILEALGIEMKCAVLSGGRIEDLGRDERVDETIREAEELVARIGGRAKHFQILIEDAIKWANLIVAPEGISGNLIFRSLILIGEGEEYGAPVLGIPEIFVDTSRAMREDGYLRSLLMANALRCIR